mgnify:CR=1 FL=1
MYRFKPTVEYIPQKRLERVMQRASFQSYQSDLDRVEEDCWDFSGLSEVCLLYTSPSPRDLSTSRMPSSA